MRPGSRVNFSKSRAAIATTVFTSGLLLRQDPEVGILERRRLGPKRGQGLIDRVDDLVSGSAVQVDDELTLFLKGNLQLGQLPAQRLGCARRCAGARALA